MSDNSIEQDIQGKGLTAPRVMPAEIEAEIASEHCFTAAEGVIGAFAAGGMEKSGGDFLVMAEAASPDLLHQNLGLLTFCVLRLRNGFTVTGESAFASPENFDAEIGRKIARQNAVAKIWPLLGFRLRDRLSER